MAIKTNLIIDQGSDFSVIINVTDSNSEPLNLQGYTGKSQMRKYFTSSTFYEFDVEVDDVNGLVSLSMESAITNTIKPGRYVFDCELFSSANVVSRIVEGIVTVTPGVTR